ncbi:hypothetical protein, partial [Shigella flexneri]|uniref:hypothetical protein n=1 Tax=Shigella flexneri TaxID=623 RepID=UPI001C0A7E4F
LTDFGGKTSIFSHPVYLFLRKFSLQDSRGGSKITQLQNFRFQFSHRAGTRSTEPFSGGGNS